MRHYTINQKRPHGINWYKCAHCRKETPGRDEMIMHLEVVHGISDDTPDEMTVMDLRDMARENGLAIRGSKADITQRLQEAGVL